MEDLVTHLRDLAATQRRLHAIEYGESKVYDDHRLTYEEAADEIERLRVLTRNHYAYGPRNCEHYRPLEKPTRYPLELSANLHICLWAEDGTHKWTIAYFLRSKEGYDLHFVGDRPFKSRVNWDHFRECAVQGQRIADEKFANGD